MPLPPGITTCAITYGRALGGALGTIASIQATVETDRDLVWEATGDTLFATPEKVEPAQAGGWLSFDAPHVDQDGYVDRSGNPIKDFALILKVVVKFNGQTDKRFEIPFQPRVGEIEKDLDKLPAGSITRPVVTPNTSVTSIVGADGTTLTGPVTQAQLEALGLGGGGVAGSRTRVPLHVFLGESNSGGLAKNSELTAPQRAPRPAVLIWDNDTNDGFDVLDIGTNNLRGHAQTTGVTDPDGGGTYDQTRHGWENGLADSAEASQWLGQVYLLKAGQGGSTLAEWENSDPYWTNFVARLTAAVAHLRAQGLEPNVYVWASIGINDKAQGTSAATYRTRLVDWLARIRGTVTSLTGVPNIPVAFTTLTDNQADYNDQLATVAASDPLFFLIDTTGLPLYPDASHWTSAAMDSIAASTIAVMRSRVGQGEQYPVALASLASGPLALLARIEALEAAAGGGGGGGGTEPGTLTPLAWTSLSSGVVDDGGGTIRHAGGDAGNVGGVSTTALNANSFDVVADLADNTNSSAVILAIEPDASAGYDFSSNEPFTAAVYQFSGDVYRATAASNAADSGVNVTFPGKLRLRNVGDDVRAEVSTDAGATWTAVHTFPSALAGLTQVWVKVIFATGAAGARLTVQAA